MNRFLNNKLAIFIFVFPALALFTVVVFYPITQTLFRSMFEWDGIGEGTFIALDNYKRLFDDRLFYTSIMNGTIFALVLVLIQLPLASVLAFALKDVKMRGKKLLRTAYFIPVVLSVTVVCQLWIAVYNPQFGLINRLLESMGIDYQQDWLSSTKVAIVAIAITNAWQNMGYIFALLFAGMKSIPDHYFEAAKIDGASERQVNFKITMPLLAETYKMCLIMAITGGFNAFANMYIMTNGGPGTSSYTLTFMMYRSAFRISEYGYGCASAVVLVVQCLVATIIVNKLIARERIVY